LPSAFRVKVTPVPLVTRLPLSSPSAASLEAGAVWEDGETDEPDDEPRLRSADETSEAPVDVPAVGAGPAGAPVSDAVAGPPVDAAVCGAAVWAAGLEPAPVPFDVGLTRGEPVVVGATVLGVVDFTTGGAVVVVVIDWSTASDTFDPPDPTSGTVVVGAGAAVVAVVAGAAVLGGVAGATDAGVLAGVP
jgi:hypothetical protein